MKAARVPHPVRQTRNVVSSADTCTIMALIDWRSYHILEWWARADFSMSCLGCCATCCAGDSSFGSFPFWSLATCLVSGQLPLSLIHRGKTLVWLQQVLWLQIKSRMFLIHCPSVVLWRLLSLLRARHRKNKDSASKVEVDSIASMRERQKGFKQLSGRQQGQPSERPSHPHESYKHTGNAPLEIAFTKSGAQTSQAAAKALAPYIGREICKFSGGNTVATAAQNAVPLLFITDLSKTALQFAIEGRILNNYGTFKLRLDDAKFPRYFKVDIVDRQNFDTVTVVVEESLLAHFVARLPIGRYVRIEGASFRRKNRVDGGTSAYSIYVDSATIIDIPPFPVTLTFFPEKTLRQFFDEARVQHTRGAKQHLGTLTFVIIQADNLEPKIGATCGELLVADGPTIGDRATLTFVNDQKDDYANIVKDAEQGLTLTFIARNIGVFMSRDNTLSVLDLTILLHVRSPCLRQQLLETYDKQMEYLGYGREVHGDLVFTNINGVLVEVICYDCKSNKVYKVADGLYCVVCSKITKPLESARLHAKIRIDKDTVISTQLLGPIVDKVLHLQKPFRYLYAESVIGVREILAYTIHRGLFKLNRAGNVCDFTKEKI